MNDTWEEEIQTFLIGNFGFRTEKIDLFKEALTHSSNGLPNNQRLALIGDAVLKLIIREHYFKEHPEWTKGDITFFKCNLIETDGNYAKIASNLNIFRYIKLGGTYNNRRDDANITTVNAEAFEAIFGAIYLENCSINDTKKTVEKLNTVIPFLS